MSEPVTSPSDVIHFQARHRPALPSGEYSVTVRHQISLAGVTPDRVVDADTKFASDPLSFGVFGPRYVLHDSDVEAEFPPRSAQGKFGEVLPHIILSRATLPWERSGSAASGPNATPFPWLALLVFSEGEIQVSNLAVGTIQPTNPLSPIRTVTLSGEAVDVPTDPVTCIDVDFSLLKQLLPDSGNPATHFSLLTHPRCIDFTDPKNGGTVRSEERAVVVASRLPEQGKRIQAHLVSLENCYESTPSGLQFLGGRPTDTNKIRLISLYSWDFFCQADNADSFEHIVSRLDAGLLRLESAVVTSGAAAVQQEARQFLDSGFIPLVHRFRQGDTSASWYHGPLLPARKPAVGAAPPQFANARSADALLLYNARQGLFDVSYAAAWELGRLLMLENTRMAAALYQWKRARAQAQLARDAMNQPVRPQGAALNALPLGAAPPAAGQPPFPSDLANWFQQHLGLLSGVPFHYLVPDEGYLPKESLRFFFLDPVWIECLFDGAFAVARTTTKDVQFDSILRSELPPLRAVGGILVRSAAVAGWPGLSVDAFPNSTMATRDNPAPNKLTVLRREQLAPNVLLVLFDGAPAAVDLHLAPETVHFGLDEPVNGVFHKTLRATVNSGVIRSITPGAQVSVPAPNAKRRIDIIGLAANVLSAVRHTTVSPTALTDADLAPFALQMIESVPVTRFTVS